MSEQKNRKNLCPGEWDIFLQPPALHCWGPFPRIGLWRGREAWTRHSASQEQVPLGPWQLMLPQQPVTHPRGGHWQEHFFLRNSLGCFFSSLTHYLICNKTLSPSSTARGSPAWQHEEKAPGEVRQPWELPVPLLPGDRHHARERWHLRGAVPRHFGTCSLLVARARFVWETTTLLMANSSDWNISVPGRFPNLNFAVMFHLFYKNWGRGDQWFFPT